MCPLRVQLMLLRLQKYDLKVQYIPGKHLLTTDALSRENEQASSDNKLTDDVQLHVNVVINKMPISDQRLAEIKGVRHLFHPSTLRNNPLEEDSTCRSSLWI